MAYDELQREPAELIADFIEHTRRSLLTTCSITWNGAPTTGWRRTPQSRHWSMC